MSDYHSVVSDYSPSLSDTFPPDPVVVHRLPDSSLASSSFNIPAPNIPIVHSTVTPVILTPDTVPIDVQPFGPTRPPPGIVNFPSPGTPLVRSPGSSVFLTTLVPNQIDNFQPIHHFDAPLVHPSPTPIPIPIRANEIPVPTGFDSKPRPKIFAPTPAEVERRPIVFFDITVDGVPAGTVFIELFNGTVPRTCENFRSLAAGKL